MIYLLALKLGKTRDELLGSIDIDELYDWIALNEVDPFTEARDDLRMGTLASVIANCLTGKSFKPSDFIPQFEEVELSEEEHEQKLVFAGMMLCAAAGGQITNVKAGG